MVDFGRSSTGSLLPSKVTGQLSTVAHSPKFHFLVSLIRLLAPGLFEDRKGAPAELRHVHLCNYVALFDANLTSPSTEPHVTRHDSARTFLFMGASSWCLLATNQSDPGSNLSRVCFLLTRLRCLGTTALAWVPSETLAYWKVPGWERRQFEQTWLKPQDHWEHCGE